MNRCYQNYFSFHCIFNELFGTACIKPHIVFSFEVFSHQGELWCKQIYFLSSWILCICCHRSCNIWASCWWSRSWSSQWCKYVSCTCLIRNMHRNNFTKVNYFLTINLQMLIKDLQVCPKPTQISNPCFLLGEEQRVYRLYFQQWPQILPTDKLLLVQRLIIYTFMDLLDLMWTGSK